MKGISGMSSAIAAAMILSTGMIVKHPIMEDADESPRPKPDERFRPTAEAEAGRIRKAQEKRERKAAKLRAKP